MTFQGIKIYNQDEADFAIKYLRPFTPIYFYNNKITREGRIAGVKETRIINYPPHLSKYYLPFYSPINNFIYFLPKNRHTGQNPIDELTEKLKKIL